MRTDGGHCRESTGTEPVVLKAVPIRVTGAAFSGLTPWANFSCASKLIGA